MTTTTIQTAMELKRNCPEPGCGKPQMSNGLITWCDQGHVYREPKTMLIYSTPQNAGKCRSCGAEIVWAMTEKSRRMPMSRDFESLGHEGQGGLFLRVYCDQSHFANCPNAKRHRKGGGKQ